jgi:hypothetical protein
MLLKTGLATLGTSGPLGIKLHSYILIYIKIILKKIAIPSKNLTYL